VHISSAGLSQFLKYAENNRFINHLILNNNSFHGEAISCLELYLEKETHLTILEMRDCNLQSFAGLAIKNGIILNKRLEKLLLANNSLGDEGIKLISEGIPWNRHISVIEIHNNKFETQGGWVFLESVLLNQ